MRKQKYMLVRVAYYAGVASVEPLGLEYLAGVLKEEDREYVFHDECLYSRFFRVGQIIKKIKKHDVTAVCFTVMSDKAERIIRVIAQLKMRFPELTIIVGGPEVTVNYQDFFLDTIDFVYYDYGLDSFKYAVAHDFNADLMGKSPGLAYKVNGKWIQGPRGNPVSGYIVKPDRSLYYENREKYRIIAKGSFSTIKTTFSCQQQCNFCVSRQFNGGVYTEREIEGVVNEIIEIDNDRIWLVDDDFLANKERVAAICNKLIARNCFKTYMIFARADSIVNCADIMPLLYQAGFRDMLVGLEAVEDEILDQYNKKTSVSINEAAIKLLRDNNMLCNGLFVINYTFNHKNFREIHRFIRKQKLIWVLFSILIPFKGTKIYEENFDRLHKYRYKRTDGTYILLKPEKISGFLFYIQFHLLYCLHYPRLYSAALTGRYKKYINRGGS